MQFKVFGNLNFLVATEAIKEAENFSDANSCNSQMNCFRQKELLSAESHRLSGKLIGCYCRHEVKTDTREIVLQLQ